MLTGTNKDYVDARIPHLSKLLNPDLDQVIEESDVLIINTKEREFIEKLKLVQDKIIIDFVRLGDDFLHLKNYTGINWGNKDGGTYISNEDTVILK
jgi:GDP-mannose 6-dehydrogenase